MPAWQFELFSYTAVLFGQRQLLLSLLGLLLVIACSWVWRRQASASLLAIWLFLFSWVIWAPLVFTPERLHGFQAPLRDTWSQIAPIDVFTLCSHSVVHHLRSIPLDRVALSSWSAPLLVAWSLLAGWQLRSSWRRRRRFVVIAHRAAVLDGPVYSAMVTRWRTTLRIRRPVQLRTSRACGQAFTLGFLRPVIHLPDIFLRELTPAQLDAVVGHEMAHIKFCDDLILRLQRLLRALFFFNPVIGMVSRRIAELREHCCDRLAIERGSLSAKNYGTSLLRTLQLAREEGTDDAVTALHSSPLRRRIESLTQRRVRFSAVPVTVTAMLLVTLSLLFGHTDTAPKSVLESDRILAAMGAVSPVPGHAMTAKPFIWPDRCHIGHIRPIAYHPGVDFATPAGVTTPIRAITDGKVTHVVRRERQPGVQIYIRHANGLVSSYHHLDDARVRTGAAVARGETIAVNNGSALRHVHVEVAHRGQALDPSYLLTLDR